jgi:hypothetical protein
MSKKTKIEKESELIKEIYDFDGDKKKKLIKKIKAKLAGKKDYEIYHKSYTSAVQEAEDFAKKNGYEVDKEQMAQDIGLNTQRPKEGKTTKFRIDLFKDGKEQRKKLHAQVFGMPSGNYELNMYIS